MCILILFRNYFPSYPLVLCANRDEYYDRPASPPQWVAAQEHDLAYLAPRDDRAGGTWIGLNSASGLCAVTNRRSRKIDPHAPSRGKLCAEVLAKGGAEVMTRWGLELAAGKGYNGFNLLLADPGQAFLLSNAGGEITCRGLSDGIHVLTNEHDCNEVSVPWPRGADEEELFPRLMALLKTHEPLDAGGFSPCKHFEGRGTRSSTIIALGRDRAHFLATDGPPCTQAFNDFSRLLPAAQAESLPWSRPRPS